jgi:hypothetical protein
MLRLERVVHSIFVPQQLMLRRYEMKSGLLWYDNSSAILDKKIQDAAKRYQQKFGAAPNIAFVNPKDMQTEAKIKNITVKAKSTILPNHIWLGIEGR